MTGKERRWINPNKGSVKILERNLDMIVSRFLYPHLSQVWNPYSWLLEFMWLPTGRFRSASSALLMLNER